MIIKKEITTGIRIKKLKNGTIINRYSHVLKGAYIGKNCMIGEHCYVGAKAYIGNNVRIQNHNNIYDGVVLGNGVFVAPAVVFTNDHNPHIKKKVFRPDKIIVNSGVSICANTTIIAPRIIGKDSLIGAGSVVLRDIKESEIVYGVIK